MDVAEAAVPSKLNGTFALKEDQRMAPKVLLSGKDVFIPNWLEQEFSETQLCIARSDAGLVLPLTSVRSFQVLPTGSTPQI